MKQAFRESLQLNKKNKEKLNMVNKIIEEYARQGYTLTLRQLYYQLVARGIIPNSKKEYHKLSALLVKGRMGGVVDWNAIEDRIRVPYIPFYVSDVPEAIEVITKQYRLDRQEGQEVYIELWCEKDALSNVLKRITKKYHIHLMVNRGYSSCSAMYDSYKRLKMEQGKEIIILYLGDYDPSGLDMIRDIKERLLGFGLNVEVKHIGITREQINKYNPPPNPAKITDPRAKWYLAEHGNISWEVDALKPEVLNELVKNEVESLIDIETYQEMLEQEEKDKEVLREMQNLHTRGRL